MKISLVIILLFFLAIENVHITENRSTVNDIDCISLDHCMVNTDTITISRQFPWSQDNPCKLGNYKVQGVIPTMLDSLTALALEKRLTIGYNSSKVSSNYHGIDYTSNGINYSAAIDISVRCLSENHIRQLLDELSMRGFAGWYRKNGKDGWSGDNHIHAVWVAAPLKQQLVHQVKKWLLGKNGLKSDKEYKFWTPKPEALEQIRLTFNQENPN